MSFFTAVLLAGAVGARAAALNSTVTAAPTTTAPSPTSPGTPLTEPCAIASSAWAAQSPTNPTPTIAASLAHECLSSVPLGKDAAIQLVDAIQPYLEWQSDAAYKADPPSSYPYPAYDMYDALAKVKANVEADQYDSEYAFELDLYLTVFAAAHDGHMVFYPDALTRVFEFRRDRALVSISEDGESLPVIKLYEDVVADPETASVVKLIDGVDAAEFVEKTVRKATYNQDIDAAYNSMFFEKSNFAVSGSRGYFANGGRGRYLYPGANTTFTYENGTELTVENKADIISFMTNITDGQAYYDTFCSPKVLNGTGDNSTASGAGQTTTPKITTVSLAAGNSSGVVGYPKPVMTTDDGIVSGYFLEGEGFEDVAVIAVLAFENDLPAQFQSVAADFYDAARQAGKTKLVVDFQANGGGYILQGFDFFRQLFPHVVQDGFSRWKATDSFLAMSEAISRGVAHVDPFTEPNPNLVADWETWFNYRYDLNLTNQNFTSFEDKFGAHHYQDTRYTSLMRWNLTDPLATTNETFGLGIEISGYGSLANLTQPFRPEDIVMLYDGVCASTCTLASEFLRIHGGVKSVALGGRPKEGAIQGVGGVKGAQVLQFTDIRQFAMEALANTTDPAKKAELERFNIVPIIRGTASAVNVRDQILRDHVDDGLPAQYVVEEADCRLYWTAAMVDDAAEIWKAAAGAAFNGEKCAHGGIAYPEGKKGASASSASTASSAPKMSRTKNINKDAKVPIDSLLWRAMHEQKAVP